MAGMMLRKMSVVLLTILKWGLQGTLIVLNLVFGAVRLFLLLLALLAGILLSILGISVRR